MPGGTAPAPSGVQGDGEGDGEGVGDGDGVGVPPERGSVSSWVVVAPGGIETV